MMTVFRKFIIQRGLLPGIENHSSPIWMINLRSLRIIYANKAALQLHGYTAKELKGVTLRDIIPSIELAAFENKVIQKASALRYMGVWKHLAKNGSLLLVRVWVVDIKYGFTRARLVRMEDVTPVHVLNNIHTN